LVENYPTTEHKHKAKWCQRPDEQIYMLYAWPSIILLIIKEAHIYIYVYMFVHTFPTPSHHFLKPDFTCFCALEPEVFSVNGPRVRKPLTPVKYSQTQSTGVMNILFSYSKSSTRPVKLSWHEQFGVPVVPQ
jgi:hypothetical protein